MTNEQISDLLNWLRQAPAMQALVVELLEERGQAESLRSRLKLLAFERANLDGGEAAPPQPRIIPAIPRRPEPPAGTIAKLSTDLIRLALNHSWQAGFYTNTLAEAAGCSIETVISALRFAAREGLGTFNDEGRFVLSAKAIVETPRS